MQGHKRYSGFMQSCLAHGIRESERNVIWFATSERNDIFSYTQDKLLGLLKDKSAVVCYNDKIAVKLLKLCRDNGIRVPEDISVVGIDDSRYASICEVPLTTVHHPQKKLGEAAARLLLDMIEGREMSPGDMLFTPELVVRESVADLRLSSLDKMQLGQRKKSVR
jgi:GntR family transcriptional regulator of arabinose operon